MVFKWKEEHTPLFLEHYKKYPCLWNYKTEGYKIRECRVSATKSLIKDLNISGVTEEDIKLKIKSIRTRYTCELTKIKRSTKSGCSTEDIYVPKLFWFKKADEFLNAVCVPREGTSKSIPAPPPVFTETQSPASWSPVVEYIKTEKDQEPPPVSAEARYSVQSQTANDEEPLANKSHAPKNRKRFSDTAIDKVIKHLKIISDNAKKNPEDEFDLFCRSLAVQLKRMPLHRALSCQQKLQEVMVQERLQFNNTSPPYDSSRSSSLS